MESLEKHSMRPPRTSDTAYIFAYGSLLRRGETPGGADGTPCVLNGFRRRWNVAMDNSRSLPGYKYYVDAKTGERPAVFVTFLNIMPDPEFHVHGVVFPVGRGGLGEFDDRERNYERHDVRGLVSMPFDGPVWAYVGTQAARRRYAAGVAQGRAVISRAYYDKVLEDFAAFGGAMRDEFERTTDAPEVPIGELTRLAVGETVGV